MNRRTFLQRTSLLPVAVGVAGCEAPDNGGNDRNESRSDDEPGATDDDEPAGTPVIPRIDDPPDAVYLPGHRKSMRVLEPIETGDYAVAPMLTYPHPFWVVTGTDTQLVEPEAGRGVHLMVTVWDPKTKTVIPVDIGPRATIERDGDRIASRSLWPMLSQEMGVHFGDNVVLPADGRYTVTLTVGPIPTRRTGTLKDRLTDRATATFEFTYDEQFRQNVVDGIELLERERWGERGALEPMLGHSGESHNDSGDSTAGIPYSALPSAEGYPGTHLIDPNAESDISSGEVRPSSGDATVVATLLEAGSRLSGDDERYLLVSPRTPYNRVPLANMTLRATVDRTGTSILDRTLEPTLDDEFGFHYGRSVAAVQPGDSVTIIVESPPQTARHQGYETAFFDANSIELVVSGA
ncbi:iron transporter [Natrinema halophilum]|uniref:Iron transporter n=1 Tax=Natrinema halophilum TaxID=1699371 RepID=A0A7D5GFK3_9EURY|nr:iron transporter [Natrinema halophilum]QLG47668.1 iron transporter [Natrinema halophilum]